ncbi:hypothetical protein [Methylobacillus flagellatus]|uniref:hypothetical protein n=1 Tax=Methylobacillus flagellatus TaxID=405 RepID=UPI0010F82309|nr:hypothetical protein [Methylobacillus flagellatus]
MNIRELLLQTLTPVLDNTWAVELPDNPTFPAIVYDVRTEPEGWACAGQVAYEQHTVAIVIIAETVEEIDPLHRAATAALMALPEYLADGEHGDAAFEEAPQLFGYFSNHVIRLRNI